METFELTLIGGAFVSSVVSGTLGMGGGILLLALMAEFFPPLLLIPVHGVVQLASNLSRTLLHLKRVNWQIASLFGLGAVVGTAVSSQFVISIPKDLFRVGLGLFILAITFLPRPKDFLTIKGKWFFVGAGAGFVSLFVGATGPLIASFYVREGLKKEALVATKAICQCFVHLFKVGTYIALGFVLGPHLPLVLGMIVAVILGNTAGKFLLHRLSERLFYLIFRALILALALRLIGKGVGIW